MEEKNETHTPLNRRQFLKLAGVTGSAALLAACAQKATEVPTEAPQAETTGGEETAPAAEQVTISWWNQFSTPTCQEVFPKVVKDFETLNPNIKVEFEITGGPPGGGDYFEVLLARIAAGNSPDSITLWTPPSEFGAQGALMAIDTNMESAKVAKKDAFYEGPMKSCQLKGQTFGLPASAGAGSMFYNKALLEEAGLSSKREDFPKTWDELQAWSDQKAASGQTPWCIGLESGAASKASGEGGAQLGIGEGGACARDTGRPSSAA